jgi:hypothetical protein
MTQVPDPNFKITLSPKKKTEKILPTGNTQTSNTNSQQSPSGNATENSKQPTAQPNITLKPQNSPTQAEIAANQKRETEQSLQHLKISVITSQDKLINVDYSKRPPLLQKEIDKATTSKQYLQTDFSVYGLEQLKLNTESLTKSFEGLKDEWEHVDEDISELLSSLKESIFKVEVVKVNYNAYIDPTEKRLMEIMPIESHESEKRNDFRTKLNNTTYLIGLVQSEIAKHQSDKRFKNPVGLENNLLTVESLAKNNLILIRQKSFVLEELTMRVQRLNGITRGESLESGNQNTDDDDMEMLYHVREMSLAPTEDGRQRVKKILLQKMNHPDKLKT